MVIQLRPFEPADREAVVQLWIACELTRPWNDPDLDIERKLAVADDMFLVATDDGAVVGTVMAGYDGHRGWLNYLAVDPARQGTGLGAGLVVEAERRLAALGCPKVNLQIRSTNVRAVEFYERIGYTTDDVISMGKRLVDDG